MARGKSKGDITKAEAVRQTLAELGNDAKPLQIQDHLKTKFGMDMATSVISNYKSVLLKRARGKKARRGSPKAQAEAAAPNHVSPPDGIRLEDIRAVKQLVDQMGAEKVRQLAEVLAK